MNELRVLGVAMVLLLAFAAMLKTAVGAEMGGRIRTGVIEPGPIDNQCVADLKRLGMPAWRKYMERYDGGELDISHTSTASESVSPLYAEAWTLNIQGEKQLALGSSPAVIYCVNERYFFVVSRTGTSTRYALNEAVRFESGSPLLRGMLRHSRNILTTPVLIWGQPLIHFFENLGPGEFSIVRAEYADLEVGKKVIVAFRYEGKKGENPFPDPRCLYWAEIVPDKGWLVVCSGVENVVFGTEVLRIVTSTTLQDQGNGIYSPRQVLREFEDVKQGVVEISTSNVSSIRPSQVAAEAFYLPYYGISEDVLSTGYSNTSRLVLGIVAIVGLFLAVQLYRVNSRRS